MNDKYLLSSAIGPIITPAIIETSPVCPVISETSDKHLQSHHKNILGALNNDKVKENNEAKEGVVTTVKYVENLSEEDFKKEFSIPTKFTQYYKNGKMRSVEVKVIEGIFYIHSAKDLSHIKSFPISYIREIRGGFLSSEFELVKDIAIEEKCFVIGYGYMKSISLEADNEKTADKWILGLYRYSQMMSKSTQDFHKSYYRSIFKSKHKEYLNFKEFEEIFLVLNYKITKEAISSFFPRILSDHHLKSFSLSFEKFYEIVISLSKRKEIEEIYNKFAKSKVKMKARELYSFLTSEQHEITSLNKLRKYLKRYELENKKKFDINSFESFLSSPHFNSIVDHSYLSTVHQSMDYPLSDYYIKSSHNSYLEGDQYKSRSSVDMYANLLKHNYRCIELDCWDGADGEPVIFHGYTRTTKIRFSDVCRCIATYAFHSSPYPLILSIELHCSYEQQIKMAELFRYHLGEMIALPQPNATKLPSPNDLKNKILIKSIYSAKELGEIVFFGIINMKHMMRHEKNLNVVLNIPESIATDPLLIPWNKLHLTRIYPKGTRINSSNFNPCHSWSYGSQIVALNAQTKGKKLWLSDGKFQINGDCGYHLKPTPLHSTCSFEYNPSTFHLSPHSCPILLSIHVFGARHLPVRKEGKIVSPALTIYVDGIPSDHHIRSTAIIRNNGFNPNWNEKFEFKIYLPEAALILFIIYDYNTKISKLKGGQTFRKKKLCYYNTSLQYLNLGYRSIPMQCSDSYNLLPFCDLFCHISISSIN